MLKGNFIQPIVYHLYKRGVKEFKLDKFFNIRKTTNVEAFWRCTFYIHNGRNYIFNDSDDISYKLNNYNFFFKLGQYSYNKQVKVKHTSHVSLYGIEKDLRKKKGMFIKAKKTKKFIFSKK